MIQDKTTIAFEANPTIASVAFGLALGYMPKMFKELESASNEGFAVTPEKQEEIMAVLEAAFQKANEVVGTKEGIRKDPEFMAQVEELFGEPLVI